jgi:hypothetical protein
LWAALALPLVLVAGCGGDHATDAATDPAPTASSPSAASPSASPSSRPASPQCAEVWQAGETLPRGYDGCYEGERRVRANGRYCEFGKPLLTYDDRFYAVRGGRIAEAEKPFGQDAGYQGVLATCSG